MTRPTVVVVGAGPTGISAATLLASCGVEVLVLERWPEVYSQPRAVHLDDEIYRILARLGVDEEFAGISRPALGLRLQDVHHRVFAEFRRTTTSGRHGYSQANMFDQPELEAVLRDNLRGRDHVTLRSDVEVTRVLPEGSDHVRVDFTDRATGAQESLVVEYVLGCDGANSLVRTSIGASMRDLNFDQRWLVVDVNTDRDLAQWDGVHQVCDSRRAATYMRIGRRRYRWEFQLGEDESARDFATVAQLRPLLEPWVGAVPDEDLRLVRSAEYTFRAQVADRWREGRIFLLGDAAHLTPPFIGQGMGAGMRDALNLTWKLAHVIEGALDESMLDTYQRERAPHATQMIHLAMAMGTAMTRGGRGGDFLRRLVAPRLHLVPGLRRRILDGVTPRLSRSALVLRRPLRPGLPGTLCPNAPIGNGQRFDDLAAGRFSLVTRDRLDAPFDLRTIYVKAGEPLHDWLIRGRVSAALIRPDGVVMAASPHGSELLSLVPLRGSS